MTTLKNLIELEQKTKKLLENEVSAICREIENTPIKGVTPLNSFCFTIKLSTLRENDNWTAEYYCPKIQANYVKKALERSETISSFVNKIETIIETKQIKIGINKYGVNPTTISILKSHLEC